MKKITAGFYLLFCLSANLFAQTKNISGIWEGKLNAGVEIRIVFHFSKNTDGAYAGTMDSPDQGVKGISCSAVSVNGDSVIAEIKVANGMFKGALTDDSTITGLWLQGSATLPLILKHVEEVAQLNRPQTPKPPYSYNSEDVEYDNTDKSIHFGATFTYPKTGGPFATAILITGSGQQDRDETLFEHKPFAVIADYLTKKGYAVLRVDDRGIGKTTGDVKSATSADFAKDVEAGLQYLKTRKEVDKNKTGMIGHSEGGLIESIVASRNKKISFIIMLAGPGLPGSDILLQQQTDALKNAGVSEDAFNAFYTLTKNTLQIIHDNNEQNDSVVENKIMQSYDDWKASHPYSVLSALHADKSTAEMYAKQISIELKPWFRYFIATDPAKFLEKVTCPVLALDGSKDIQVYADKNIPAIANALEKAHNKNVTTKIFPGLNHLFQHCNTCTVQEYGQLEETFAPEALDAMGEWLDKNIMNKSE